jgi:hypothetical protein
LRKIGQLAAPASAARIHQRAANRQWPTLELARNDAARLIFLVS